MFVYLYIYMICIYIIYKSIYPIDLSYNTQKIMVINDSTENSVSNADLMCFELHGALEKQQHTYFCYFLEHCLVIHMSCNKHMVLNWYWGKHLIAQCWWNKPAYYWYMMASSNGIIFRVTGPLCGNSQVTDEFATQRPMTRSFDVMFSLIWINGWENNGEAGQIWDAIALIMISL